MSVSAANTRNPAKGRSQSTKSAKTKQCRNRGRKLNRPRATTEKHESTKVKPCSKPEQLKPVESQHKRWLRQFQIILSDKFATLKMNENSISCLNLATYFKQYASFSKLPGIRFEPCADIECVLSFQPQTQALEGDDSEDKAWLSLFRTNGMFIITGVSSHLLQFCTINIPDVGTYMSFKELQKFVIDVWISIAQNTLPIAIEHEDVTPKYADEVKEFINSVKACHDRYIDIVYKHEYIPDTESAADI